MTLTRAVAARIVHAENEIRRYDEQITKIEEKQYSARRRYQQKLRLEHERASNAIILKNRKAALLHKLSLLLDEEPIRRKAVLEAEKYFSQISIIINRIEHYRKTAKRMKMDPDAIAHIRELEQAYNTLYQQIKHIKDLMESLEVLDANVLNLRYELAKVFNDQEELYRFLWAQAREQKRSNKKRIKALEKKLNIEKKEIEVTEDMIVQGKPDSHIITDADIVERL